ncbi:MAG: ribonuclease HII [Bacteroidales bacterium]|nr:ribonuclease HII [Bacteroidales bacterium]
MLKNCYNKGVVEAGCDEAGRGCLAGPVYAAAVILPANYSNEKLNDSKQLTERQRYELREQIERDAVAWAVAAVNNEEIDKINILNASFHAMNMAVKKLKKTPESLLIDGNRFKNETDLPFQCIVKGDGKYLSIAAASILAKTYRDDYMLEAHKRFPAYGWDTNKGYPTSKHYDAIEQYGISPLHRKTYALYRQKELQFN